MSEPKFRDGEPENIEAALLDALQWLSVMAELKVFWRPERTEDRERLARCITVAKRFLLEGASCGTEIERLKRENTELKRREAQRQVAQRDGYE